MNFIASDQRQEFFESDDGITERSIFNARAEKMSLKLRWDGIGGGIARPDI